MRICAHQDESGYCASRGLSAKAMLEDTNWNHGPDFLWQNEHSWPEILIDNTRVLDDNSEVKHGITSCITTLKSDSPADRLLSHYSDWNRVRKAVAWYQRFVHWLSNKNPKMNKVLGISELQTAERAIICYIQAGYGKEIENLETKP